MSPKAVSWGADEVEVLSPSLASAMMGFAMPSLHTWIMSKCLREVRCAATREGGVRAAPIDARGGSEVSVTARPGGWRRRVGVVQLWKRVYGPEILGQSRCHAAVEARR